MNKRERWAKIKPRVIADRVKGLSPKELVAKYDISEATVFNWCRGVVSPVDHRGDWKNARYAPLKAKARAMRAKGEKLDVIAAKLGVRSGTVSRWCADIPVTARVVNAKGLGSLNTKLWRAGLPAVERARILDQERARMSGQEMRHAA